MTLIRWNPLSDVSTGVREMQRNISRIFDEFLADTKSGDDTNLFRWNPAIDVAEKEDRYIIEAEVPGMARDDLKITVSGDMLTLSGEKKQEKEEKKKNYHRSERLYGSFSRSFALPGGISSGRVDASYKEGVLTIVIPKSEESRKKETEIKIK